MNLRDKILKLHLSIGLSFIGASYIISSAHLGLNGNHIWRQADVYASILGFLEHKNFTNFDTFIFSQKNIYDIPIYQYIIAIFSSGLKVDPLVVARFFNALIWLSVIHSGYKVLERHHSSLAGFIFIFLMTTSTLVLHYFSSPLPDNLSIGLSMLGMFLLTSYNKSNYSLAIVALLLSIATLIKSPIPFAFVIFYMSLILCGATALNTKNSKLLQTNINLKLLAILIIISVIAILAELLRGWLLGSTNIGFNQSPSWYFGSLNLRLSKDYWVRIITRLDNSGPLHFLPIYISVTLTALAFDKGKKNIIFTAASLAAFFSGWLVFANVYFIHDYYQLPIIIILYLSFSVSLSTLIIIIGEKINREINTNNTNSFTSVMLTMVVLISASYIVIYHNSISQRSRVNIYNSIEFALSNTDRVLVIDSDNSAPNQNPAIGGLLSTKLETISANDFENECDTYFNENKAFFSKKSSKCLDQNKASSSFYIKNKDGTFLKKSE